jgi:hypothetical protein
MDLDRRAADGGCYRWALWRAKLRATANKSMTWHDLCFIRMAGGGHFARHVMLMQRRKP